MKVLAILAIFSLVYVSLMTDAQNYAVLLANFTNTNTTGVDKGVMFQLPSGKILAASPNFNVTESEISYLAIGFADPKAITTFTIAKVPYAIVKSDGRTIFGKKNPTGIICCTTLINGVCGTYTGDGTSIGSIAAVTVVYQAKYMYQVYL